MEVLYRDSLKNMKSIRTLVVDARGKVKMAKRKDNEISDEFAEKKDCFRAVSFLLVHVSLTLRHELQKTLLHHHSLKCM